MRRSAGKKDERRRDRGRIGAFKCAHYLRLYPRCGFTDDGWDLFMGEGLKQVGRHSWYMRGVVMQHRQRFASPLHEHGGVTRRGPLHSSSRVYVPPMLTHVSLQTANVGVGSVCNAAYSLLPHRTTLSPFTFPSALSLSPPFTSRPPSQQPIRSTSPYPPKSPGSSTSVSPQRRRHGLEISRAEGRAS